VKDSTRKRREFESNRGLFDRRNALKRDDEFCRRNSYGWVVYRGWEDNDDADILMRSKRREKERRRR
jgi:hypothetical protein